MGPVEQVIRQVTVSDQIDPPPRLLMGPGPITVDPRILRAMSAQLVGQYDPAMTACMNETQALYREVFGTVNEATVLVDGTSRAGIEAALVSLISPGDTVLVPVFGRFGHLLREIAERCGADVRVVEVPWGEVFTLEALEEAVREVRPSLVAMVQGDTSTTMLQPLEGVGAMCHRYDALLYVDCTASIAGNPFEMDAWEIDAATAGLQKCLGGPSGSAPLSLSPRAVAVIDARRSVEAGLRADPYASEGSEETAPAPVRIRSNYFDLGMILDYWSEKRLNHHTEATTMLYGARECARLVLQEGLAEGIARHELHGRAVLAGLEGLGLTVYGDVAHKMTNVVAVFVPEGVDGEAVRSELLLDYGIEIGTSFGPLAGKVWRVGTMGYNARKDAVLVTLASLEAVLRAHGATVEPGGGTRAAQEVYA